MSEPIRLDSVDRAILRELQQDGRIPNKTLAARVGVAPSTCLDRTARLQGAGAITGYTVNIDPRVLGHEVEAMLAIVFQSHARPLVDPFVEYVRSLPQTRALYHLTGGDDFLIHVTCTSAVALQELVLDLTARREVGRVQTHLVFQTWPGGPILPE